MPHLTNEQITRFIEDGVVVIDDLLPISVIDDAQASMDTLYAEHPEKRTGIIEYATGAGLEALYQHENLERAAQQILDAERVELVGTATLHKAPQRETWSYNAESEHVDAQFNLDEWHSSPRHVFVVFMVFLDDVPADRAPTVVRLGSHMQLARHLGSAPAYRAKPVFIKDLPELGYAEPTPLTGTKGQVAVGTTALVHTGSHNASDKPRKLLFVTFAPRGSKLCFNVDREHRRLAYLEGLQKRLPPARRYIVESTIAGLKGIHA